MVSTIVTLLKTLMRKFSHLSYREVIEKNLKVMDATAITMCMESNIPIMFKLDKPGCVKKAILGESNGTLVESV